jgi:ATP-dependent Clp protease ATP-binding subunit ClpC
LFERYTEMARQVIFYSKYTSQQVGSPEIDTEHLLLGLLRADKRLARRFLGSPWAAQAVWTAIAQRKPAREKLPGPVDLPLSNASKRVLSLAADQADQLSSKHIGSEHLLLGLLREKKCFAAEVLHAHGVNLASTLEELTREPHNDSIMEAFTRERGSLPDDVVELQGRIKSIVSRMEEAIAKHDFIKARACADEERMERDKLRLVYEKHGLSDWIFD